MNVAFIVTVNLDDTSDLPGVASEIEDDLTNGGFDVTMVHAWQRPSLTQVAPITVPTTTTQPIINPNQVIQ
jgi:hypothetical protein